MSAELFKGFSVRDPYDDLEVFDKQIDKNAIDQKDRMKYAQQFMQDRHRAKEMAKNAKLEKDNIEIVSPDEIG